MKSLGRNASGSINGVALFFLALLTIVGASLISMSIGEVWISRNEQIRKKEFYIAEGGAQREAREIGAGNYPAGGESLPLVVATDKSPSLPVPAPHRILGESYQFSIEYKGAFPALKGFSSKNFSRYDYDVQVLHGKAQIKARYARIGPKMM